MVLLVIKVVLHLWLGSWPSTPHPFLVNPVPIVRDVLFYLVALLLLCYVYLSVEIFLWQPVGFDLCFVWIVFQMNLGLSGGRRKGGFCLAKIMWKGNWLQWLLITSKSVANSFGSPFKSQNIIIFCSFFLSLSCPFSGHLFMFRWICILVFFLI